MSYIAAGNTTTTALTTYGDTTGNLVFTTGGANTTALTLSNTQVANFTNPILVGGNQAMNGPAFSAYCNTNQSIPSGSATKIQINTKEFDTNNCFDSTTNYRFTPTVSGYYLISGCVYFNIAPTTFQGASLIIYKNGSTFKLVNIDANSNGGHFGGTVTSVINLNGTTDYIELYVYQVTGSSYNLSGSASQTYLSGSMVRGA